MTAEFISALLEYIDRKIADEIASLKYNDYESGTGYLGDYKISELRDKILELAEKNCIESSPEEDDPDDVSVKSMVSVPTLAKAIQHIADDNCLAIRNDWLERLSKACDDNLSAHDVALSQLMPNELEDFCMGESSVIAAIANTYRLHFTAALLNRLFDGDLHDVVFL